MTMKKISYLIGGFVVIALAFFVWSSVSKDAINVEDIVWLEYQSENFDIAFEYPEIASVSEVGSGEFSDLSDSEFEYLGSIKINSGTILGITWSVNGHKKEMSTNLKNIGKFCGRYDWEEIEESPSEEGYGAGANMFVQFLRKI